MKKNTRTILAVIALVFMVAFTVMIVICLYDTSAMNGSVVYLALGCGVAAIGIYLLLMYDNRLKNERDVMQKAEEESAKKILENSETAGGSSTSKNSDENISVTVEPIEKNSIITGDGKVKNAGNSPAPNKSGAVKTTNDKNTTVNTKNVTINNKK